jgi:hypothetical protein
MVIASGSTTDAFEMIRESAAEAAVTASEESHGVGVAAEGGASG